jgi:hypothetical protein
LISSGVKKKLVKSSLIRDKKDPASAWTESPLEI